jgi:hypothetical protein
MKIDSFNMYRFTFSYEGTELMIPMAAATQEEAMKKLRDFMAGWMSEMTVNPTLSPVQFNGPTSDPEFKNKPPEPLPPDPMVLMMRIEEMVQKLIPLKKPKGAASVERLVKEWTGFPMEPANYPAIIAELGRLQI